MEEEAEPVGENRTLASAIEERGRDLAYQASRSFSPTVLLMASFRRGAFGILVGLIGLAAYWIGGILLVFGALALIWAATHSGPHKPVPIGGSLANIFEIFGIGCLFLLFATMLLRAFLRLLRRRKTPI